MSWAEQESLAKKVEVLSAQNQSLQARYKEDVQWYNNYVNAVLGDLHIMFKRVIHTCMLEYYCNTSAYFNILCLFSLKNALEDAEQDRDNLRYKLSESKRENDKLSEKLSCFGPNYDASKRQIEGIIAQREKLKKQVESLERDLRVTREKLVSTTVISRGEPQRETGPSEELSDLKAELSRVRQESQGVAKERERLVEENGELRSKVDRMEGRVHSLEMECQRLGQKIYNCHV